MVRCKAGAAFYTPNNIQIDPLKVGVSPKRNLQRHPGSHNDKLSSSSAVLPYLSHKAPEFTDATIINASIF